MTISDNSFTMPDSDVVIKAVFEAPPTYSVIITTEGEGVTSAFSFPDPPKEGTTVSLLAMPLLGYEFEKWEVVSGDITIAEDNTFIMPDSDVSIKAVFYALPTYSVTVTAEGKGVTSFNSFPNPPNEGTTVSLLAVPLYGYEFKEWKVVSGEVTISEDDTFVMPASPVSIKAIFEPLSYITDPKLPINEPEKVNGDETKIESSSSTPIQLSGNTAIIGVEGVDDVVMRINFEGSVTKDTVTGSITGNVQNSSVEYKQTSAESGSGVGGTINYQLTLLLENATTAIPMIHAGIEQDIVEKILSDYPKLKIAAMITAKTNVSQINNNLTKTGNGITLTFHVPTSWIDSMEKIYCFHVENGVVSKMEEIPKSQIQNLNNGYSKIILHGTSFSTYGIAGEEKVIKPPEIPDDVNDEPKGSSVWLTEPLTPTPTPTETITPIETEPITQPTPTQTEAASPLSVLAVLGGLGAASVILRRK